MEYNILSRHTDKFTPVRDNIKYFMYYEMCLNVNKKFKDFDHFKKAMLDNIYDYEKELNYYSEEEGSEEDGSDDKISCYDLNSINNLGVGAYKDRICEYYDSPIIYGTQIMYLQLKYNRQCEYVKVDFGKIPSIFELLYTHQQLSKEICKERYGSYNGRFYFKTGNYNDEYVNVFKPDCL